MRSSVNHRTALSVCSLSSLAVLVLAAAPALAQAVPPSANGADAALTAEAMGALANGAPPASVKLTGSAVFTAGSYTDSGTIVLEASGADSSRVDLELAGGSRVSVRAPLSARPGAPPGGAAQAAGALAQEVGEADGAVRQRKLGDAFSPAAWFFPALALSAATGPNATHVTLTGLGAATVRGVTTEHLRLALAVERQKTALAAGLATLSQADFYLDPATHLPMALRFARHPDGVVNHSGVRVEIRYSDWRAVSGVEVPYHIERWMNGSRQLVVTVTSVEINPPLAGGDFQLGGAQ